jgi:hypothetical protein
MKEMHAACCAAVCESLQRRARFVWSGAQLMRRDEGGCARELGSFVRYVDTVGLGLGSVRQGALAVLDQRWVSG